MPQIMPQSWVLTLVLLIVTMMVVKSTLPTLEAQTKSSLLSTTKSKKMMW